MNPYYSLITSLCKKPKREKEKSNAERRIYIFNKYQMLKVKVRTQEYRMYMTAIVQFQIPEYNCKDDQSPFFRRIIKNS